MSATTRMRMREERVVEKPRMLRTATYARIPSTATVSTAPWPSGLQKAAR